METKVCSLCKQELDKNLFGKKKRSTDGLRSECKKCANAVARAWYNANSEKIKITRTAWNEANTGKTNARNKVWRYNNPEKAKAGANVRYHANPEKAKARSKLRYDANPDKANARSKAWNEDNSEKAKATNKVWKDAHHEATRVHSQTRRSRKAGLASTLTPEQWKSILDSFLSQCAYCGAQDKALHQEHFVALSSGGPYTQLNVIPSCKSCNSSKGVKDFFTWYPTFTYYSKVREEKIMKFLYYVGTAQQITLYT